MFELTAKEFVNEFTRLPDKRQKEVEFLIQSVPGGEWNKIPLDIQRDALNIAL